MKFIILDDDPFPGEVATPTPLLIIDGVESEKEIREEFEKGLLEYKTILKKYNELFDELLASYQTNPENFSPDPAVPNSVIWTITKDERMAPLRGQLLACGDMPFYFKGVMWNASVEHIHYLNERSDISMIPLEDYLRRFDPTKQ